MVREGRCFFCEQLKQLGCVPTNAYFKGALRDPLANTPPGLSQTFEDFRCNGNPCGSPRLAMPSASHAVHLMVAWFFGAEGHAYLTARVMFQSKTLISSGLALI